MLNVVIDTNVIISSALTPGRKADIVINSIVENKNFCWIYSNDILAEYVEVLSRPKHNFPIENQMIYINTVKSFGKLITTPPSVIPIRDEKDRCFYAAAVQSGAVLITGNKKHFPDEDFILSPAEFIERYL
ncbi:MAG: putative toxin-antitoxin system toxin component, PIN family [Oscillospiraceae bacterium]|nr:putative toxin-antitoxin system toxin component, PIN family [Oscillospiraceae bacterium]